MVRSSFSCSLLLVFLFSFAFSSYSIKTVKVEDICKQVGNPTFCLSFLTSKPGGAVGADLISLGEYTVGATRTNLQNIVILIKSLLKNTSDHNLRELYLGCQEQYEDSVEDTDSAKKCLKAGSCYDEINQVASAILDSADECAGNGDIPLPDTNPLKKNSQVIGYLSDILLVISNFLMQKQN